MNVPDTRNSEPGSKARLRLWLRLLRATRTIEAEIRENLRLHHDTTLPRFDVLAALYRTEQGLKMSELSGQLRVSNGNVTGIVDRLVDDGQIKRVPVDGDRRAMRVVLTNSGRADFEGLAAKHEAWIDELLGQVSPDEALVMAERLRAIVADVDGRNT